MSCSNLTGLAAQWTPAFIRQVGYQPWLGSWVPQVILSYPQWDQKDVTYAAPVLGPLAWIVGGRPTCAGCGTPLKVDSLPALMALCPRCYDRVAQESWTCCDRVTRGEGLRCSVPLQTPPCLHSSPHSPVISFASTPSCLESHELIVLWFTAGHARACVLPSSRASVAIAASGALVARRYHMRGRMAFLEDWEVVIAHVRESHLPVSTNLQALPSHQIINKESLAALTLFADTSGPKRKDLPEASRRELFTPLDALLSQHHIVPFEESVAQRRYFLPHRFPRNRPSLEMPPGGGPLAIIGSGVGAWGPWFFLRKLDGIIVQLNFSTLLGRHATDSPLLLPGPALRPLSPLEVDLEPGSIPGGVRLAARDTSPVGAGASAHLDGGE